MDEMDLMGSMDECLLTFAKPSPQGEGTRLQQVVAIGCSPDQASAPTAGSLSHWERGGVRAHALLLSLLS
ncbi:MAG: hypothetical protein RBU21_07240, partial [FCB group bacterium]|nr:hypothetical protein [FCB group bacterium]